MTIDEAIAEIEQSGLYGNQVHQETLVLARDALRTQQHRENPQPSTNAGRIRSMSDEEMARFLDEISGFQADYLKYKGKAIDVVHLIDWLRQPAEEEQT